MKKHISTYIILSALVIIVSCKKETTKPLLQHDVKTLQAVMLDLYVAEQALKNVNEVKKDSLRDLYKKQIEEIHEIDIDEVESDIDLIKSDPTWYLEVHKVVKDSIVKLESNTKLKKPTKQQQKIEEEIKKAAEEKKRN